MNFVFHFEIARELLHGQLRASMRRGAACVEFSVLQWIATAEINVPSVFALFMSSIRT